MNILHAQITYYPPQVGRTDIFEYTKSLAKNHQVFTLATKREGEKATEVINNVKVLRLPIDTRESLFNSLYFILAIPFYTFWKISRQYKSQIDILHIYSPFALSFLTIAAVRLLNLLLGKKVKVIFDIRTGSLRGKIKRELNHLFLKLSRSLAHQTVILDQKLAQQIFGNTHKKLSVVPLGANINHFQPSAEIRKALRQKLGINDKIVFVAIGSLDPRREFSNFIEAFAKIAKERSDCRLLIIGEGKDKSNLEALVESKKIAGYVTFIGQVDYQEIPAYLQAADIGVAYIPLKDYYLNQPPLKTAEYLAAGLPVIATATNGNKVFVKDGYNGILTDASISATASGIKNIIEKKAALANNARRSIEKFNWDCIVKDKLLPLYHKLLGSKQLGE